MSDVSGLYTDQSTGVLGITSCLLISLLALFIFSIYSTFNIYCCYSLKERTEDRKKLFRTASGELSIR